MKMLILAVMICGQVWGQDPHEISTQITEADLSQKFVSSVRDAQLESSLNRTAEFQECMNKAGSTFSATADETVRREAARKASECLRLKLQGKTKEEIEALEASLNLSGYRLIPSRNVRDITNYLTNKMYQNITGVNLDEQNTRKLIEDMKFGKKKIVDQKSFIELYKTQLVKNGLFEVSRFCIEKLRIGSYSLDPLPQVDFKTHWDSETASSTYNDSGNPIFSINSTNESDLYKGFAESLQLNDPNQVKTLGGFFAKCMEQMRVLCTNFEKKITPTIGGNACLAKAKIAEIKKNSANAEKILAQFRTMDGSNSGIVVGDLNKAQINRDELTNYSSSDILNGGEDADLKSKQEKCITNQDQPECDDFLISDDGYSRADYDSIVAMDLKKNLEIQKVTAMKSDPVSLEKYLEENGYGELLVAYRLDRANFNFEVELGKIFDARKIALLENLKNNVGSRQRSESDINASAVPDQARNDIIRLNAETSKEERSRLAQVVFFNNIVTSSLNLTRTKADGTTESLGSNVNAARQELSSLQSGDIQVEASLFSGLQRNIDENQTTRTEGEDDVSGLDFLNPILGFPSATQP